MTQGKPKFYDAFVLSVVCVTSSFFAPSLRRSLQTSEVTHTGSGSISLWSFAGVVGAYWMHAQDQRMLPVMDLYARLSRRAAVEDKTTVWASRSLSPLLNHQDY